jgi:hypothetical protein
MIFTKFVNAPKHEDAQREGKLETLEFDRDNGESNWVDEDGSNELDDEKKA